jgi:O-antigen ligase
MSQSELTIARGNPPLSPLVLLGGLFGLALLIALNSIELTEAMVLAAGTVFLIWAAWRVQGDNAHLLCAIVMIELFCSATVLPISDEQRFIVRYPILLLFCLPATVRSLRNPMLRRGGFRDFLLYLGLGGVSVIYSLAPTYSFARAVAAILIFIPAVKFATDARDERDVQRLLKWFMVAVGLVWLGLLAALVAVPHDVGWVQDEMGMMRFRGFFGSPNQVGEVTLVTVATVPLIWSACSRRQKTVLLILAAVAIALGAAADSRSPFVGLTIGGLAYAFWRYRLRALPVCLIAGVLGLVMATIVAPQYFTRGDVSTLTGRTDVWKFTIHEIKRSPLLGYGFEVEGDILQSKYFPVWWGPWDEGPHSSLHNGYLSRAIGLGVPALLFWLFFFLRPWVWLFVSGADPWHLKRVFLLVIVPVLVVNCAESGSGDCRFAVGVLATLCWAIAERQRIQATNPDQSKPIAENVLTIAARVSRA